MNKKNGLTFGIITAVVILACACPATSLPIPNEPPTTGAPPSIPTVSIILTEVPANVLFSDNFSVTSPELEDYTDENGTVETKDGVYVVRAISDLWHWGQSTSEFDDTVIEFDATLITGPVNNNAGFGVACRLTARDDTSVDGYMLAISGDGYYTIRSITASSMEPLVDWTYSDAVKQGNLTNQIRATCNGSELKLEVNGELLASANTIADGSNFGAVAFAAISFEDAEPIAEIHFDNLVVSQP